MAHGYRLERLRRERQKALANGDTRRAAKLGIREQRVERKLAPHRLLALGMVDPEMDAIEIASAAGLAKHPVRLAPSGPAAQTGPATQTGQAAQAGQARRNGRGAPAGRVSAMSPASAPNIDRLPGGGRSGPKHRSVMDDAREVAARRKRQLGWGSEQPRSRREA